MYTKSSTFALVLLLACALTLTQCVLVRAEGTPDMLRLHIIASSDSYEDQQAKLAVRDIVLEFMNEMSECETEREAETFILQNGSELLYTVEEKLASLGLDYGAQLIIGEFDFPNRVYGNRLYPKGKYRALRIILGSGEGHNWWCVMFPSICISGNETGKIDISELKLKSWIIEKLKSIDGGKLWGKIKLKFA